MHLIISAASGDEPGCHNFLHFRDREEGITFICLDCQPEGHPRTIEGMYKAYGLYNFLTLEEFEEALSICTRTE